jgi:hypothetical protein
MASAIMRRSICHARSPPTADAPAELLALRLAIDVATRQRFPSLLERMKDAGLAKNADDPSLHEFLIEVLSDIIAQWRYAECEGTLYLLNERKRHALQTADVFEH